MLMKIKILFIYLLTLLFACNNADDDNSDSNFLGDDTIVYKSITNIDKNLTSLDIYTLPNSKKLQPVVIWIHGGAWAIGDKTNKMDLKVPFFKSLDYILVSVNYRLSPFPDELNNANRIKHPDHITDVADALQWIYQNIHLYGGDKLNIVIMGHSAGAHLAALMGTNQSLLSNRNINPNHIKGIGVIDTQAYDIEKVINTLFVNDLYVNAFGNEKQNQLDASPYFQMDNSAIITPLWLFPERGTQTRKGFLNDFILKLENRSTVITKIDANVYTHAEVNDLIGDTSNTLMTDAISIFLKDCFK